MCYLKLELLWIREKEKKDKQNIVKQFSWPGTAFRPFQEGYARPIKYPFWAKIETTLGSSCLPQFFQGVAYDYKNRKLNCRTTFAAGGCRLSLTVFFPPPRHLQ